MPFRAKHQEKVKITSLQQCVVYLYQELLTSHFFTARNIITAWDDVLKAEFRSGERVPKQTVDTAREEDFHNIALVSEGRAIGFMKTIVAEQAPMRSDN